MSEVLLERCNCSLPDKGKYIGNQDAFICNKCKKIVSGYECRQRMEKKPKINMEAVTFTDATAEFWNSSDK